MPLSGSARIAWRNERKENAVEWLSQNWVWVLIAVGFVAMHLFGHGGHGGHGGQGGSGRRSTDKETGDAGTDKPAGHRH